MSGTTKCSILLSYNRKSAKAYTVYKYMCSIRRARRLYETDMGIPGIPLISSEYYANNNNVQFTALLYIYKNSWGADKFL
jgi:hypothetical protein